MLRSTLRLYAEDAGYPSFAPMFEANKDISCSLYLALLSPSSRDDDTQIAVQILRGCVSKSSNAASEVIALLRDENWRTQIVAAVAILLGVDTRLAIRALWIAFEEGSWISPQLAVTAFLKDPNFEQEARWRIEAGCPIRTEPLEQMDWATRHSSSGPISLATHSAKALASLVAACRTVPAWSPWLEDALKNEEIQAKLNGETDNGGLIAAYWLDHIDSIRKHAG